MRNLRLLVAYDGSAFAGWQRQEGFASVQQSLEEAVAQVTGEKVTVHGAGRTDAGVHALGQVAHFRSATSLPDERILHALNAHLPPSVTVRGVSTAAPDFHARFSARGKRYVYRLVATPLRPPLARELIAWIPYRLDVARMRQGAAYLVGEHDFASFATEPRRPRASTVRRVQHLHLVSRRERVDLFIQGDGFLYNMVRAVAGSLIEVGRGKREPAWIRDVLEAKDRKRGGPTAPPQGLYLLRVLYGARRK
jgi:tRNA pseudouridine38-40 synthase